MSAEYRHSQLAGRVASLGVLNRWFTSPGGTHEQLVALSMMTSPEGALCWCLSIDLVAPNGQAVLGVPMAYYPGNLRGNAYEDALKVAEVAKLSARMATDGTGWMAIYDPDDEPSVQPTGDVDFEV